jgi:alpha-tubulin suppressor-like RCC1 family protein
MLDLNHDNGKLATLGLVLPKVESADTFNIAAEGQTGRYYPNVVTPDATYSTQVVSGTDEEGEAFTDYYYVADPAKEAPGGTIVYDESTDGIRWKKSSNFGNWSINIVDRSLLEDTINYRLLGGADFKLIKASCGVDYSVAINALDGGVYTTGRNLYYRTGKGRSAGSASWALILGGPAIDVSAGYNHGMAVLENGDLYVWGSNSNGKTGRGTRSGYTMAPTKITLPNGEKAVRCEAGYYNSLVLTEAGNVYACGSNQYGRNGNGIATNTYQTTFQKINFPGDITIKEIKRATHMAGAIGTDGKIYIWGRGSSERLGTGNTSNQTTPVMLNTPAGVTFKLLGLTSGQGFAFTDDNKLYRWGYRGSDMLPNWVGSTTATTPVRVTQFDNFLEAGENVTVSGTMHLRTGLYYGGCMMFATDRGRVYASGRNNDDTSSGGYGGANAGKLGVVNIETGARVNEVNACTLVQDHGIYSGSDFTSISVGFEQTIITTGLNTSYRTIANYTAYSSGRNANYMLGNGPRATRIFSTVKK